MYFSGHGNDTGCDGLGCMSCSEDCNSGMGGLGRRFRRRFTRKISRVYTKVGRAFKRKKAGDIELTPEQKVALRESFALRAQGRKLSAQKLTVMLPVLERLGKKIASGVPLTKLDKLIASTFNIPIGRKPSRVTRKRLKRHAVVLKRRRASGSRLTPYQAAAKRRRDSQGRVALGQKQTRPIATRSRVRRPPVGMSPSRMGRWAILAGRRKAMLARRRAQRNKRDALRRQRAAQQRKALALSQAALLRQKTAIATMQVAASRRTSLALKQKAAQQRVQKVKIAQARKKATVTKRNYKAIKKYAEVDPTITNLEMAATAKKDMKKAKTNLRQVKIIAPEGPLPSPVMRKVTNPMTPMTSVKEYKKKTAFTSKAPVGRSGINKVTIIAGAGAGILLLFLASKKLLHKKRKVADVST